MLKRKKTRLPLPSNVRDYKVIVTVPFNIATRKEEELYWTRILWSIRQCRAYKAFIQELGYEAKIIKREYAGKISEGAMILSEEPVR